MVIGLSIFKDFFKEYQDTYMIIGGTACDFLIEDAGFEPRATDDIDMVLIVEALTPEFVQKFWEFIKEGGYEIKQINEEKRNCYRFCTPTNKTFPKQIELFSTVPDAIDHNGEFHLTPIPTIDGVSNLSAILLNEDYYSFTVDHSDIREGVHYANIEAIICLKAYAYLDNVKRKKAGQDVRQRDIDKHKYDIFRMVFLLPEESKFILPEFIKNHLQEFTDQVKKALPTPDIFKNNGFGEQNMELLYNLLKTIFDLD
ncbi:MAG: hypothetical protein RL331_1643 [Bacteroidota bacterium]|jgi:hypothetical protein